MNVLKLQRIFQKQQFLPNDTEKTINFLFFRNCENIGGKIDLINNLHLLVQTKFPTFTSLERRFLVLQPNNIGRFDRKIPDRNF